MALPMTAPLGSALSVRQSAPRAGYLGNRAPISVAVRATRSSSSRQMTMAAGQEYPSNWLNKDPLVPVLGFLGWTIPANIPVPAFGNSSLFGEFTKSIGENLAKFPQPPALQDKFWLLLITYHVGLFVALLLGQIGVNGRRQGYW